MQQEKDVGLSIMLRSDEVHMQSMVEALKRKEQAEMKGGEK